MRIVVARAQGLHRAEAPNAHRHDGGLRSTGEHDFGVAHFDRPPGFANRVGGRGAGGARGQIRSPQLVEHGKKSRGHVQNEHGDEER